MAVAIEFDFQQKHEAQVPLDGVCDACGKGRYCWIDFEPDEHDAAHELLLELQLEPETVHAILGEKNGHQFNVFPKCLQFVVTESRFVGEEFESNSVKVILGERFLITIRSGAVQFLKQVFQTYKEGFHTAALSPGFLLFEFADHLTHVYRETLTHFSEKIDDVEVQLMKKPDDQIFIRASELIRRLLEYRKTMISAREIIHELATRRSPFIPETTQPFLEKKAILLERLSADATTEREVLSECLNLYMGIVSYHTNNVVTRLTVVSTIFLPLSFLVGLYGMNFKYMPELNWQYGYIGFWAVAGGLVLGLLFLMKRNRWL